MLNLEILCIGIYKIFIRKQVWKYFLLNQFQNMNIEFSSKIFSALQLSDVPRWEASAAICIPCTASESISMLKALMYICIISFTDPKLSEPRPVDVVVQSCSVVAKLQMLFADLHISRKYLFYSLLNILLLQWGQWGCTGLRTTIPTSPIAATFLLNFCYLFDINYEYYWNKMNKQKTTNIPHPPPHLPPLPPQSLSSGCWVLAALVRRKREQRTARVFITILTIG